MRIVRGVSPTFSPTYKNKNILLFIIDTSIKKRETHADKNIITGIINITTTNTRYHTNKTKKIYAMTFI